MATEPQKKKFAQFVDSELKDDCVVFLNQLIKVAGLSLDGLGTIWGVTVCVDKETLLRVNVANWEFARVFYNKKLLRNQAMISVIGKPKSSISLPFSVIVMKGFEAIENQFTIWVNLGKDSTKTLANRKIAESAGKSVEAMMAERRGLPNPNWHNPLTNSLITAI